MARRESVSAVNFVKVYTPLAKEGKSALEIGRALGLKGTDKQISAYVSVKASQLRKSLKEAALLKAKESELNSEDTEALVKEMADKLPRLKHRGRESQVAEVVSAIDEVLNQLNGVD